MIYLTFTNEFSGVYQSQVIDVCRFLEAEFGVPTHVVSLISVRRCLRERSRLGRAYGRSIVVPMVPGVRNWRMNALLLQPLVRTMGERVLIGRSEFATNIGLLLRERGVLDRVVYDGRSARAAEAAEYDLGGRRVFSPAEIEELERRAVGEADFRLGVSSRLVDYWRERLAYQGEGHAVIPCTVDTSSADGGISPSREELGLRKDQVLMVFAGSSSHWQSFELLDSVACATLESDPRTALLLLSDLEEDRLLCQRRFPDRVCRRWVEPQRVREHLGLADHGLLLREPSITNSVACPTKFAEYLNAGLGVVVSEGVGDLPDFVREHACGVVVHGGQEPLRLERVERPARRRHARLAQEHFGKPAHRRSYSRMLEAVEFLDDSSDTAGCDGGVES